MGTMTKTPNERLRELALSFPTMRSKHAEDPAGNGLEPFSAERLAQASRPWTSNEKHVVAFLLTVDDRDQTLVPPFNIVEAILGWDSSQRRAFAAWVAKQYAL